MKNLILFLAVMSSPAFAALGVPNGKYTGTGTLKSDSFFILDLHLVSEREVTEDMIVVQTKADLFGMVLAEAAARLKFVESDRVGGFEILDMDAGGARAGKGKCFDGKCVFEATIMGGKLSLKETWISTATGFKVSEGSQVFDGKAGTYNGTFVRNTN